MSDNETKPDFYSGVPWINVDPEMARAHPKGKLTVLLWLIAGYFVFIGLLKFGIVIWYGFGFSIALLNAIFPLLTGLGLAFRVPWSVVLASVASGLTVYALIRGLGGDGDLLVLFESIANVGILFYLMEGDRPNFIYRHRYRKYSVEPGQGGDD